MRHGFLKRAPPTGQPYPFTPAPKLCNILLMDEIQRRELGVSRELEAELGEGNAQRIRLFRLVLRVGQSMRTRMDEALRVDGLTTQQAALMTVVEAMGSPSLTQAAAELGTTHQNSRQVADALIRKGFLRIVQDPQDGRVRRLVTTPKSDAYWRRRSPADCERVYGWFDGLSEDQVAALFELLWRVGENLRTDRSSDLPRLTQ
jgi:DNA-binding MarR family transcriptional regulator